MNARNRRLLALVGLVALFTSASLCTSEIASAATVTETFSFTANGLDPPGGPVDVQTGSFTLTFDPALTYVDAPLDAISLTVPGHTYSLSETGFLTNPPGANGELTFGGLLNGVISDQGGTEDFFLSGQVDASGNAIPDTWAYCYSLASSPNVGWCSGGDLGGAGTSVVVESKPASVTSAPEPPTIVLLCLGLLVLGALHRQRRARSFWQRGHSS